MLIELIFCIFAILQGGSCDLIEMQSAVVAEEPVADKPISEPHTHSSVELPEIASKVATCESGDGQGTYSLTAKNPNSSASGKYQFIDSTWEWVTGLPAPASAHPELVQDQAFIDLWDDGDGASHWAPSRSCWG